MAVKYEKKPFINSTENKKYEYDGGEIETSKLKIKVRGTQSRYDMSSMIIIRVHFYNQGDYNAETNKYSYTDGNYQNISIVPYASGSEVNYKTEEIDLDNNYIKSIQIIGDATEIKIYKESIVLTSDNYKDIVNEGIASGDIDVGSGGSGLPGTGEGSGGSFGNEGSGGLVPECQGITIVTDNEKDFTTNELFETLNIYFIVDEAYYSEENLSVTRDPITGDVLRISSQVNLEIIDPPGVTSGGINNSLITDVCELTRLAYNSNFVINHVEQSLEKYQLKAFSSGTITLKATLRNNNLIYGTAQVGMNNCEITTINLTIDSEDGKIHINNSSLLKVDFGEKESIADLQKYGSFNFKWMSDNGASIKFIDSSGRSTTNDKTIAGGTREIYVKGVKAGTIILTVVGKATARNYYTMRYKFDVVA